MPARTRKISGDLWVGNDSREWKVLRASHNDVDEAIEQLDGKRKTMVIVHGEGEKQLVVGGGAGGYVVYVSFNDDKFWNLASKTPKEGKALLFIGGQEGEYPGSTIVTKEQARAAAHVFMDAEALDPAQKWLEQ
jgi:Immunity protein Imm1